MTLLRKLQANRKIWEYLLLLLICTSFIAFNAWYMTRHTVWFNLIPLVLLVIYLALFSLDKLLLMVAFLVPFSTTLQELGIYNPLKVEMDLPTEPILFGVMLICLIKLVFNANAFRHIWSHPITWAIGFYLFWMCFTAITSTMIGVSIKMFITRLWYITSFYLLGILMFKDRANIKRFVQIFAFALGCVAIITMVKHAIRGFDKETAHWIMSPFFKDHTSYGAILAMFLPFMMGFVLYSKDSKIVKLYNMLWVGVIALATILSYTRAAWVSLVFALGVYIVMKLRIRFSFLLGSLIVLGSFFFSFQTEILQSLSKNNQDSSDNLTEHIESISNISTDASNLERLNRWNSAFRMFEEHPIIGWGPGTYQFQYGPFQMERDKTFISTNSGTMGNAHSEYIGPLAESGVLGAFSVILLITIVFYTGIKLYFMLEDKELKMLVMSALLGLITYFVHGMMNNFLDMDKASVPVWGFIGIIVCIDLFHKKKAAE